MTNFIGRSIEREEDIKLLQGEARFVDDMPFRKDTLHASFVRSPYPHAKILNINVSEAIKVNGVEAVLLGEDCCSHTTVWPSGLRRQTQVLVVQTAWVRTPPLTC